MDIVKARRIVRLVERMRLTWDELADLYPIPKGSAPWLLYHEAWCVCFKADIDELTASIRKLAASTKE